MVRADKNFGQHFLINDGIIAKIADTVQRQALRLGNDTVIEIGPGPGALTRALLDRKLKVLAVELDRRMIDELTTRFAPELASHQLELRSEDATRLAVDGLPPSLQSPFVLCGNLPYNVGSNIVFHALETMPRAQVFCFMLQKEVVARLKADAGSKAYGIPSIKLAWGAEVLDHFWVSPGSFAPPPKVDSGVVTYRRLEPPLADPLERNGRYDRASVLLNRLFQSRRKMIGSVVHELRESPHAKKRPEELTPAELLALADPLADPPEIG